MCVIFRLSGVRGAPHRTIYTKSFPSPFSPQLQTPKPPYPQPPISSHRAVLVYWLWKCFEFGGQLIVDALAPYYLCDCGRVLETMPLSRKKACSSCRESKARYSLNFPY